MRALTIVLIVFVGFTVILNVVDSGKHPIRLEKFVENPVSPHDGPLPQITPSSCDHQRKPEELEALIKDLKAQSHQISRHLAALTGALEDQSAREYKVGCESDHDCNTIQWSDNKKNICRVDHTCACESGSGPFCTVPARYKDPSIMTNAERERFKRQNDLSTFKPKDYANWLLLYKDCQEELTSDHLKNLQLLLNGSSLPKAIPEKRESPPRSVKQYLDLLDAGKSLAIRDVNLDSGVYLPSNYTAYDMFIPPKELEHIGVANTDSYKQTDLSALSDKIIPQILPKVT